MQPTAQTVGQQQKDFSPEGAKENPANGIHPQTRTSNAFMANTKALAKDERKKAKRTARKKQKTEKPLGKRAGARGAAKRKVKKMVRGTSKR
jgi:hypothetical protein